MSVAYLLDPTNQYQNRAGVNNVNGYFEVFEMNTDDRATVYTDFAGTLAPARIGIDNNGRAVMIVESGIPYRVEMHEPNGDLVFTQQPVYTVATGGGASVTRVTSTDGSIGVEATTIGSVTTFDLSSGRDSSDLLEWVRCDGAEKMSGTDVYRPTYTDGTLYIGDKGIELGEGRYYHVTAHIRATKNTQREPFYDKIYIGLQTNDGTNTTQITRKSEIIDYSLGLTQEFEFSTDVYAQADCELELVINGSDVAGGDIEVVDVEAHRIFSGSPAIPSGVVSRAYAAANYQRKLIAGQNITITETDEGDVISSTGGGGGGGGGATYQGGDGIVVNNTTYRISIDDSVVQEKLTAGDNITIEDNVISATVPSVDISGKADKVSDAVNGNLAGLDSNGNLTDSGIAADRVVTDPDYVHTDNNFTTELKNKLVNIEAGAEANVQADWLEENSSSDAYIRNKPDMSQYATPEDIEQLEQDISGKADKVSGAVNGNIAGLDSTGNLTDSGISASDVATQSDLAGKQDTLIAGNNITIVDNVISATGGGSFTQVQSDWNETDPSEVSYIQNKPTIPAGVIVDQTYDATSTNAQSGTAVAEAVAGVNAVPSSTSSDENKVLTVDSTGTPVWATAQGGAAVSFITATSTQSEITTAVTSGKPVYYLGTYSSYTDLCIPYTLSYTYSSKLYYVFSGVFKYCDNFSESQYQYTRIYNATDGSWVTMTELDAIRSLPSSNVSQSGRVLTVSSNGYPQWSTASTVAPVQDVTVGGTSVVSGGTAAIPAQVQSDWAESDSSAVSYVQNKPTEINLIAGTGISLTRTAQGLVISLA